MTKNKSVVRKKLKEVKSDSHASRVLRALRATGLFRWERPSTKSEEVLNILTHGIGIGLAMAGLTLLVVFAVLAHNTWAIVSCAIFGLTMFTLYFGSTMCHAMIGQKSECFFEVWDSVAIYALIAGTYTPFCLVNLRGGLGWTVFGILWAITIFGAIMKIARPKQQPKWMVALYLVMGWMAIFVLPQCWKQGGPMFVGLMLAGGLCYSIGTIFYTRKKPYSHFIWHLWIAIAALIFLAAITLYL